jgi:poly(3-hydroxybutyrate) depolymerase
MILRMIAAVLALSLAGGAANAEILSKTGRFAGAAVEYKVLLPPGYNPAKAYPAVLVFTGGGQSIAAAENTIVTDWKPEADKRGYIVISPAAPGGELFFQGGDKVFPAFLDAMRKDYKVAGKLHVAGHSNGGLSAFHIAAKYPAYFSTVTGYPGLWEDNPEAEYPQGLKSMCLYMHVGDMDSDWRRAMEQQAREISGLGYRIKITVEKNQSHRLKAAELDLPRRLFDEIERCK